MLHESLAISRQLGDEYGIVVTLHNLGIAAFAEGDYSAARALHQESLEIARRIGDQYGIAESLESFATLSCSVGRPERGVRLWGSAATLREQIGALMSPHERQECDAQLASAREALGDAAFNAAWAEGQAHSWRQAAEYALSEED